MHRPHVAGIHGRENEGAYSIVLSGGYEDDVDNGVEFSYTGSGGRDLSGNKRTAKQSSDQTLTHLNKYTLSHIDHCIVYVMWSPLSSVEPWPSTAVLLSMTRMEQKPKIGRRESLSE